MRIETRGFDIYVTFDEVDFQRILENGKYAWREAIDAIKKEFPFPDGKYDGETKQWIITTAPGNREKLSQIKREFFQDKNQIVADIF